MEINIKTINNGSFVLSSSSTITLEQLKQQLHLEHACPEPDEQRLVSGACIWGSMHALNFFLGKCASMSTFAFGLLLVVMSFRCIGRGC
jgi:hypothetical protein